MAYFGDLRDLLRCLRVNDSYWKSLNIGRRPFRIPVKEQIFLVNADSVVAQFLANDVERLQHGSQLPTPAQFRAQGDALFAYPSNLHTSVFPC